MECAQNHGKYGKNHGLISPERSLIFVSDDGHKKQGLRAPIGLCHRRWKKFNLDLVGQGLSPYYTKYGRSQKYNHEFRSAEKLARRQGLNIWGDPELTQKYLRLKSKWGQSSSTAPEVDHQKSVQADAGAYIGNKRSHKFHRPECRWAKTMSLKNKVVFTARQEAINQGYVPGKICKP